MHIFKNNVLALFLLLASNVSIYADTQADQFNVVKNLQLQLIPFNEAEHGSQAHAVYQKAFGWPTDTNAPFLSPNGSSAYALLFDGCVVGIIIYRDSRIGNGKIERYVSRLAINPAYQSQHCGTFLMLQFEEISRKQGIFQIALTSLDSAKSFYRKLGFTQHGGSHMVKQLISDLMPDDIQGNAPQHA
jgi:ribosomal protein S18 acetylase RimI-like enzyme